MQAKPPMVSKPAARVLLLAWAAVNATLAAAAPLSNANIQQRTTTNAITFADLSFTGASAARSDRMDVIAGVGDSGVFTVTGFRPGFSIAVTSGAGIAITNLQPADAGGVVRYTTTVVGPLDQNFTQSWTIGASTTGSGTLTLGVSPGGLHYLEFFGRNQGFLPQGGTFDYSVSMPGDWSQAGTATGQAQFLGVNPSFTVTDSFTYDPNTHTTTLRILNTNYNLAQPSTDLHFILWGQPVPEAPTAALLASGLALLGWLSRRRAARGSVQ
jgi:hypothetical protein